jgi:tRNA modification GTPase
MQINTTIAAIATPPGVGAIAVIRINGPEALTICDKIFVAAKKNKKLIDQKPYTIHYGSIVAEDVIIDQVLVSLFRSPHSYTGDDMVEISCHGSQFIQQRILEILIKNGASLAEPGGFTLRAFLNGKLDLSQAEAVADLISSTSESARRVAINQMRGGFSSKLKELREQLLHFISLVELELDFSEEDVKFADRRQLTRLIEDISEVTKRLMDSFQLGNVIKTGIPVAIVGKPNVGKSTLLNRLLNEDRAIVSEIAGTTRDTIEDTISINGYNFRFVDTAGLRHTTDTIESMGIERTYAKISQSLIVILMVDSRENEQQTITAIDEIYTKLEQHQKLLVILNKVDASTQEHTELLNNLITSKYIKASVKALSAKHDSTVDSLAQQLVTIAQVTKTDGDEVIVTNARHYESLQRAHESLLLVANGLKANIPGDLLSLDIRQVLHYLGEITGEITTDDILGSIFSKFCIGK